MRVVLIPPARAEYFSAIAYYEGENPGLGGEWRAEFEQCIERIASAPSAWQIEYRNVRRCSMKNFHTFCFLP